MRLQKVALGLGAVVTLAAGVTTAVRVNHYREPIKEPILSFEETATAVKVNIRNINNSWGLRNQPIEIALYTEAGSHSFHIYGPDEVEGSEDNPQLGEIHCCTITELRPNSIFTITVLPSRRFKTGKIRVRLADGPGWIKMKN